MDSEFVEKIKDELLKNSEYGGITIPHLCKNVGVTDEYAVLYAIAELEDSGSASLIGFDTVYREDGGAIYLAKYSAVVT